MIELGQNMIEIGNIVIRLSFMIDFRKYFLIFDHNTSKLNIILFYIIIYKYKKNLRIKN